MRIIISLSLIAILSACATKYQPERHGGGYTETQLDTNVWRVTFNGNGHSSKHQVEDYALLRGAELALKKGYTHFSFVGSNSSTQIGAFTTMPYTAGGVTYGGQTFVTSSPSATNTVVMYKGKPETNDMVYDATFVCQSLGQKYQVTCRVKK